MLATLVVGKHSLVYYIPLFFLPCIILARRWDDGSLGFVGCQCVFYIVVGIAR